MPTLQDPRSPRIALIRRSTSELQSEEQTRRLVKEPGAWRKATAWLRRLPDFLVLGAQRAGSTSLYHTLIRHPHVRGALVKEIHYFDRYYHRGAGWYRAHFPLRPAFGDGLLTGEASPSYLFHPHTPERVKRLIPHVRLIAILRHPGDRAYSQYHMNRQKGQEPLSFLEAIEREEERTRADRERQQEEPGYFGLNHRRYSYLARGRYAEQLARWLEHFPRAQLLVAPAWKFRRQPADVLREVFGFLGLPADALPDVANCNVAQYPVMEARARAWLNDYFRPHNQRLQQLLGVDLQLEQG
jgi:hypothetical protein